MPRLEELPPPWPAFLRELDQSLKVPVELHCLGGFVLAALYGLHRPTDDLDYISIIPKDSFQEIEGLAGRGSRLSKKHKVFLQNVGSMPDLPESYGERLSTLVLGLARLSLKVLAPYDIALSKLTRNSPKDREDVKFLAGAQRLNFKTLMELFDAEMKPWLPNIDRHLLTLKLWSEYFPT
jgi:hypothetical protein